MILREIRATTDQVVAVVTVSGQAVTIPVNCTDTGPQYERSNVREFITEQPQNGTAEQNLAGDPISYTPNANFIGVDFIEIGSFDEFGFGTDRGTIAITVTAPPDNGGGGGGGTTRTLSLGYSEKSDKFKGALKSNEPTCLAGKVKVFEKRKGKDPKVGADKTNGAGKWSFKEKGADGKFYGSVPATTVAAGECPAAKSKAKTVD